MIIHGAPDGSSTIKATQYDTATQRLSVEFHKGATYAYDGVPPDVHAAMQVADSKGKFHASEIVGKYPASRL